jgi:hypothetical protein
MTSAALAAVLGAAEDDDGLLVDGCPPALAVELDDPHAARSTIAPAATAAPRPRDPTRRIFTRWLLTGRPLGSLVPDSIKTYVSLRNPVHR